MGIICVPNTHETNFKSIQEFLNHHRGQIVFVIFNFLPPAILNGVTANFSSGTALAFLYLLF